MTDSKRAMKSSKRAHFMRLDYMDEIGDPKLLKGSVLMGAFDGERWRDFVVTLVFPKRGAVMVVEV